MSAETKSFRVPYGLDAQNHLVARQDAVREQSYTCPSCGAALVFRAGPRVSRNFAHRPSPTCNGETALHRAAKLLIKQVVGEALTGGPKIELLAPCGDCREEFDVGVPLASFDAVTVEAHLPSGRVVDVLLIKDGVPRLGIEVFVSHRVDADKARDLDFPWIEVVGAEIVERPRRWKAHAGKLLVERCRNCRARESLREQDLERALHKAGLVCPPGYKVSPVPCYRCGELIPIFDWGGGGWTTKTPPEPRPRTVQWRSSRQAEKSYWANTCPHCRALQGDFHVRTAILHYTNDLAERQIRARGR